MSSNGKATESQADALLDTYGAPSDVIEVVLPKGEVLKFRQIASFPELKTFMKDAAEWIEAVRESPHPDWEGLIPSDKESLSAAYTISELSIEPKFTQIEALKLLKAGWLVQYVMQRIDEQRMRYQISERSAKRVVAEKKGSRPTDGSGSVSGSAETASQEPALTT